MRHAAVAWRHGRPGTAWDLLRRSGMSDRDCLRVIRTWLRMARAAATTALIAAAKR